MQSTPQPHSSTASIEEIRSAVNTVLEDWFTEQQSHAEPISPLYAELWQTMLELSQAGGKRIRPYLTVLSYQAFGGTDTERLLPVAAAQELLHLGLLVHDDIIDRDDLRYGQANITGVYKQRFAAKTNEAEHYAMSSALLAGDLLISGSYQLALQANLQPDIATSVTQLLGNAIFDVAGGEFLDTIAVFSAIEDFDSLHIADFKTASYSFITPLLIGATVAKADKQAQELLRQLGKMLGVAYQLSDDLLGTFGDPQRTGKPVDSDILEKKRTYLLQQTFVRCTPSQRQKLAIILDKSDMSQSDIQFVRKIMIQSGAKDHVEATMQMCAKEGKKYLHALELDTQHTKLLEALIDKAVWRNH